MKCTECKVGYCAYRSTDSQRECPIQNGTGAIITKPTTSGKKGIIIPISIDWTSFRREAAKDILTGAIASGKVYADSNKTGIVKFALDYTDELIKQLKEEEK